jgi:ATPase subunit of ABC transporter with duplicated ATPase domains
MGLSVPIFLLISIYLEQVFPTEFGVRKHWSFPITDLIKLIRRYRSQGNFKRNSEEALALAIEVDQEETKFEDSDVKEEREKVLQTNIDPIQYPLYMKNMRKVYAGRGGIGPKLAVKDVTFAVERNTVFGLLGPNGFDIS